MGISELCNKDYKKYEDTAQVQARIMSTPFLSAVTSLVYALEAKDRYTNDHSGRVAELSKAIAVELGLPQDDIEKVRLAGLVHDIGKIEVSEAVLNKPGRLTDSEFYQIGCHCETGEHVLTPILENEEILKG